MRCKPRCVRPIRRRPSRRPRSRSVPAAGVRRLRGRVRDRLPNVVTRAGEVGLAGTRPPCTSWVELPVHQGHLHGGPPVLREHSPAADAHGSTTTTHLPAKISYTTQRDTVQVRAQQAVSTRDRSDLRRVGLVLERSGRGWTRVRLRRNSCARDMDSLERTDSRMDATHGTVCRERRTSREHLPLPRCCSHVRPHPWLDEPLAPGCPPAEPRPEFRPLPRSCS